MDRRRRAIRWLAKFWKRTRMLYRVLVLIRFSLRVSGRPHRLVRCGCFRQRLVGMVVRARDVLFSISESRVGVARVPTRQGTTPAHARLCRVPLHSRGALQSVTKLLAVAFGG